VKTRVKEGKNGGSEEMEKMGGIWVANFLGRKEESTRFDHTSINEAAKGNTSSGSTTTTTTTTTY